LRATSANALRLTCLADTSLHGVIFFAVCRGKVSEGLNFSDRAGRAVVITGVSACFPLARPLLVLRQTLTGIPYGMRNDPKVCLQRSTCLAQVS